MDDRPNITQESTTLKLEKEIHGMVPELNRPFKLENAFLNTTLLKTTYEEFLILYDTDARFREGYEETNVFVNVPSLFGKIIVDKNQKKVLIQTLCAKEPSLFEEFSFNSPLYQRSFAAASELPVGLSEGVADHELLKAHPLYQLTGLKPSFQSLWLTKLDYLLANRTQLFTDAFTLSNSEITEAIIRIRPVIIDRYNGFDFQGRVPKLLIDDSSRPYSPNEAMKSSAIMLFLALCSMDIVVVNDSHGATFENYITPEYYRVHYPAAVKAPSKPAFNPLAIAVIIACIALVYLIFRFI